MSTMDNKVEGKKMLSDKVMMTSPEIKVDGVRYSYALTVQDKFKPVKLVNQGLLPLTPDRFSCMQASSAISANSCELVNLTAITYLSYALQDKDKVIASLGEIVFHIQVLCNLLDIGWNEILQTNSYLKDSGGEELNKAVKVEPVEDIKYFYVIANSLELAEQGRYRPGEYDSRHKADSYCLFSLGEVVVQLVKGFSCPATHTTIFNSAEIRY